MSTDHWRDDWYRMFRELAPSSIVIPPTYINPNTANAVRYGTAKAEWFLNIVSPIQVFR